MIFKKNPIILFAFVLCLCCLAVVATAVPISEIPANAKHSQRQKIIVDAGHGGFDGGAVADDGTIEKNINLEISNVLCSILRFNGYEVITTRTTDVGTDTNSDSSIRDRKKNDLRNRLKLMENNPDAIYVSIHLNKYTTSAPCGAQVFFSKNFNESIALAEHIQSSIKERLQPENTRLIKCAGSGTYLLYNAKVPAVIVECGFLSNTKELTNLKDKTYQNKMAFSIACGIFDFLAK